MATEVGQVYEVIIEQEDNNPWTGAMGIAKLEDVFVRVPNAKKGEKIKVKILGIENNSWTGTKDARFERA
jgi:predicted RNA-binding protein with TRAM domain